MVDFKENTGTRHEGKVQEEERSCHETSRPASRRPRLLAISRLLGTNSVQFSIVALADPMRGEHQARPLIVRLEYLFVAGSYRACQ
jgi:serine/threonine protein phosphatase PrpC